MMKRFKNQDGFTLIELIASMVIMSIMFSVAAKKWNDMSHLAKMTVAIEVCHDLNSRESGIWAGTMIDGDYETDNDVWVKKNIYLNDLNWVSLTPTGGKVAVNGQVVTLTRKPSIKTTSARWSLVTDT